MLNRGNHTCFISNFRLPIADFAAINNWQSQIGNFLGGIAEDQPIKVGVIAQRVQVVIVLGANAQVRLEIERLLE
jgi:hypothetical protein